MVIDTHSHCSFSADATTSPEAMIEKAISLGLKYFAITDHCDKDYLTANVKQVRQLDDKMQFEALTTLKEKYKNKIDIGVGIEIGYSSLAVEENNRIVNAHDYDYIINSVHVVDGADAYFGNFFDGKSKEFTYSHYLMTVKESLSAPYRYETIAHIGYCTRYAPYEDRYMHYSEFPDLIDDILTTIIKTDKILEVNTNIKSPQTPTLPNVDILTRYKQLGGKLVTFGSDAHSPERILEKYDVVTESLKGLGFSELAFYHNKKIQFCKI